MPYGTIAADRITGTNGNSISPESSVFRNRIINGDMGFDQRNVGASITPADGAYSLDRWKMLMYNSASKYTVQQNAASVTPPAGFKNYMGITSSSAYSVASTDLYGIQQRIEGFNTADLDWGTSNAKTVTLSFWVRSSLTGTFGGSISNGAGNRSYPFSYTINSANTWEYETITIPGDQSGTWVGATNGIGLVLYLMIGTGSTFSTTAGAWAAGEFYSTTGATSVVGTNGATFYITGVQLEVGSTATSYEYLPYGTELMLCQRYYQVSGSGASQIVGSSYYLTSTQVNAVIPFQTTMRVAPTLIATSGTDYYGMARTNSADYFDSITLAGTGINACTVRNTTNASGTAGDAGNFGTDNASAYIGWSAEL